MGFWGAALYSGDFAMDLRSAVAAVARLPLSDDELVDALRGTEHSAADNLDDPDHTTFWLVLADQLGRRGVYPCEVRSKALQIIDQGSDLDRLRSLGAGPADIRKRQLKLAEIRAALVEAAPRSRKTLAGPQPLVMSPGEIFAFPTSCGKPINPYFKSKTLIRDWHHDGWGMLLVVETGHVFGYLAWFRVATLHGARPTPLDLEALWSEPLWQLRRPGTCSPLHLRRMEMDRCGTVRIDTEAVTRLFPDLPSPRTAAIIDKSIANNLDVGPQPIPANKYSDRGSWFRGLPQIALPALVNRKGGAREC